MNQRGDGSPFTTGRTPTYVLPNRVRLATLPPIFTRDFKIRYHLFALIITTTQMGTDGALRRTKWGRNKTVFSKSSFSRDQRPCLPSGPVNSSHSSFCLLFEEQFFYVFIQDMAKLLTSLELFSKLIAMYQ